MIDTYRVGGVDAVHPEVQRGGSYFLPKHILRVTVKEVSDKTKRRSILVASDVVADRRAIAQVGFNLSPLSDDDIKVEYETSGLLKGVAATATDRTGDIIVQLVKTVAGFRATTAEQEAAVAIYEFDPFDFNEAALVNAKLKEIGSCVEVEVRSGVWSPGCRTSAHNKASYDQAPHAREPLLAALPTLPGIYYRRPISHRVHVMEHGKTKQYLSVEFANAAPIFRIDIERTAFVERKTVINFTQGVPTLVQVIKPSEGLAVAKLPLTIAKAIISAPVEGISEHKVLQKAQADLAEEEARRIQAEQKLTSLSGIPMSAGPRSAAAGGTFDRSATGGPRITEADCRQIGLTNPQDCASALGR